MRYEKQITIAISLVLLSTLFSAAFIMPVRAARLTPPFKITLICPVPNPARQAWAAAVADNLKTLGMEATRVIYGWDIIYDRVLTPAPEMAGKTYDEGGFDALFLGYAVGTEAWLWGFYGAPEHFAPYGWNYFFYNNTEMNELIKEYVKELNLTKRIETLKDVQAILYDELPSISIIYPKGIVAFDPDLDGIEGHNYPCWPYVENWKGSLTEVTMAQTGPLSEGLNPLLTTSYYDLTIYGSLYDNIIYMDNTIDQNLLPRLASEYPSYDILENGSVVYTIRLRDDVYWHDGVKFTAEDVKFTWESVMTPALACPLYGSFVAVFGSNDSIRVVDPYTLKVTLPEPNIDFEGSVLPYPTFGIIPKHILEGVPYEDWRSHPTNTGLPSSKYPEVNGPIGTGAYKWVRYDETTMTAYLEKNLDYFNRAALEANGEFVVEKYSVVYISGIDAAISAFKAGSVHFLDSQYHLETKIEEIETAVSEGWAETYIYDDFGMQELGFNMRHPVFGTGVATPLGKEDPTKAADAAKAIRKAIAHCVPREWIVEELLKGFGSPGVQTGVARAQIGFDETLQPYTFDLDAAYAELKNAGYVPLEEASATYGLYVGVIGTIIIAVAAIYVFKIRKPTS